MLSLKDFDGKDSKKPGIGEPSDMFIPRNHCGGLKLKPFTSSVTSPKELSKIWCVVSMEK